MSVCFVAGKSDGLSLKPQRFLNESQLNKECKLKNMDVVAEMQLAQSAISHKIDSDGKY